MAPSSISPHSLGLPKKFRQYRSQQLDTALDIVSSDKRFSCLSAPVGSGKSLCYLTIAKLIGKGKRTLVLTATKNLQSQLVSDFAEIGLKDVRGQSNYRCVALDKGGYFYGRGYGPPGTNCSLAPCKAGRSCKLMWDGGCHYFDAMRAAANAQLVSSNYSLWLSLALYGDPTALGKFDLLVLDECHNAPDELTKFCALAVDKNEVRSLLGVKAPPAEEGIEVARAWAKETLHIAHNKSEEVKERINNGHEDHETVKLSIRLSALERSLEKMANSELKRTNGTASRTRIAGEVLDWIPIETDREIKHASVWAHQYAEEYLFREIKKVVLSSGTLLPSIKKRLGIDEAECDWHEVPSAFDPKRRPIIYVPTVKMDSRAVEGQHRLWARRTDEIIEPRLDRKTLIHSVSYARADEIKQRSKFGRYMLTHDSRSAKQAIERFKRAKPPCILVSPAMVEGVDFPDEELRVIIVPKVPFASAVSDPVFKARCKQDPNYRFECAALLIVQMIGRGMRSVDDWMEAFITDDHFGYLRWKVNWMQWFKAAWREEPKVPSPLQLAN